MVFVPRLFHPWVGGTERQAQKLARMLLDQGVSVRVVTGWWFRGSAQRERVDGVAVFRNHTLWEFFGVRGLRKLGGYLYMLTLATHLWRARDTYDVIHVHGLSYHTAVAALVARLAKRATLVKLANSGSASDIERMRRSAHLAFSHLLLPAALSCDRFVASTRTVAAELAAAGVPAARIVTIPNGVENERIRPKESYRRSGTSTLIFVGRLHPQKGVETLLHAVSELQGRSTRPFMLRIVGEGPLREELVGLAEKLGIGKVVSFVGATDRVADQLHTSDLFVLPSRAEGLSNALLEAMATGLPCVTSDVPGNVDVISDRQDGRVFITDDAGSLATTLAELLDDPDQCERLGRMARRTVDSMYSLACVAERYGELYRTLCDPVQPGKHAHEADA